MLYRSDPSQPGLLMKVGVPFASIPPLRWQMVSSIFVADAYAYDLKK